MRKVILGLFTFLFVLVITRALPAGAIENGTDASGNGYVVPLKMDLGSLGWYVCSGALIAPTLVVTAAHCAVDANGLANSKIYVGKAGSDFNSVTSDDQVKSVQMTSSFSSGANNTVGDDDLAFLVLSKPQTLSMPIRLASETELAGYRASSSALRAFGYGCNTDACDGTRTTPKAISGVFSQMSAPYANSGYISSSTGDICAGDSGGPIIVSTPSTAILVGVITGSQRSVNCTKKLSDGNYYGIFTMVGRYANLALSAASSSIAELEGRVSSLNEDLQTAHSEIIDLQAQVQSLKKSASQTLTCVKGQIIKKLFGQNAKCPAGYKPR